MTNKLLARIPRKTITHMFRGKFPYKVETTYPAAKYVRAPMPFGWNKNNSIWPISPEEIQRAEFMANEHRRYRTVVDNFRRLCRKYAPEDESVWGSHETQLCFHFYFMNKTDMEAFVVGNRTRVRAIYEPSCASDIQLMSEEKNVIIRNSLFHDRYRYCITFRTMTMTNAHVIAEMDGWVKEFFNDSRERYRYSPTGYARKLYLNDEHDILLTRMAYGKMISRVQKIILRSEIEI